MSKIYNLEFNNFIEDSEFEQLPAYKGVYLFRKTILDNYGIPGFSEVIYIGSATGDKGFKERLNNNHHRINDARNLIKESIKNGENAILTISYSDKTSYDASDLERAEKALIFCAQPILNDKSTEDFHQNTTIVNLKGLFRENLESSYNTDNYIDE